MIQRKNITLEDKPVFDRYFQKEENSTYNFTNMFIWSGETAITYAEVEGCLVLFFQFGKNPVSASYPLGQGDKKKAIKKVAEYLQNQGANPVFKNLSQWMAEELNSLYPQCFYITEDRNAGDYIYETEKMIYLPGNKLHGKRNHLNYFKNNFTYTYRPITSEDAGLCLRLYEEWEADKKALKGIEGSGKAVKKLLENFDVLPVSGGGIFIDDTLCAFSIGEPITENMALIHVEFAKDIRGLFNAINSEFCSHTWQSYPYVNREEDMGLPGLRKAKEAYRPVRLLEKYNAVLKTDL